MAGGDGSQAIVAALAAEHGLPYACIPAGTRNHFALDLGVDRDDVVGALDAFVDGGERVVDLAEVNGRVFVNNVSLGRLRRGRPARGLPRRQAAHAAGHRAGRHRARRRELDLRWTRPRRAEHHSGAAMLVSNNRYRLGRAIGSGTRPRIDDGLLGVTVFGAPTGRAERGRLLQRPGASGPPRPSRSTPTAPSPPASTARRCVLDPPLRFHIRPGVLRVRIARRHPGASPSARSLPTVSGTVWSTLVRIAVGHPQKPATPTNRRPEWT